MRKKKRYFSRATCFVLCAVFALLFLLPTVLTITNSFMTQSEITASYGQVFENANDGKSYISKTINLKFIPDKVSFTQYFTVLLKSPDYLLKFWNSVILTAPIVFAQLMVASIAAYGFTRWRGKVRDSLFFFYVILMLMPYQVTLVPNYLVSDWLHLLNTRWAIFLPGAFAPFSVFLLTKFMRRIPMAVIESAKIDGANEWHIFWNICLPQCRSALYSIAILVFIDNWNMVEQPLIYLANHTNLQPLSVMFNQISTVSSTVDALSEEERERILLQARSYNEQLAGEATELPADQIEPYDQQLIFDRDPMMSWVEIPSIDVSMPIYHGTSDDVLQVAVGHLEWSSLPVGGESTSLPVGGISTHCVLTAHSGMRNLSMFDDIHSLEPGDLVLLHTMNKTLAYKMVDSEVVLPEEMESLTIEPGADKVTLVTCTPYGVNDHRLLVHCMRTKYNKKDVDKQKSLAGRHWGKREFAVLIVVVAIVLLLLDIVIHAVRKRRKAKASA